MNYMQQLESELFYVNRQILDLECRRESLLKSIKQETYEKILWKIMKKFNINKKEAIEMYNNH